jgi:hypothetical protein
MSKPASEHSTYAAYMADLPATEIDRRFQAALAVIKRRPLEEDWFEDLRGGCSLTQESRLPRWMKS